MGWLDYADKVGSIVGALTGVIALVSAFMAIGPDSIIRERNLESRLLADGTLSDQDAWEYLLLLKQRERRDSFRHLLLSPITIGVATFLILFIITTLIGSPRPPWWISFTVAYASLARATLFTRRGWLAEGFVANAAGYMTIAGVILLPAGTTATLDWIFQSISGRTLPWWITVPLTILGILTLGIAAIVVNVFATAINLSGGFSSATQALSFAPQRNDIDASLELSHEATSLTLNFKANHSGEKGPDIVFMFPSKEGKLTTNAITDALMSPVDQTIADPPKETRWRTIRAWIATKLSG